MPLSQIRQQVQILSQYQHSCREQLLAVWPDCGYQASKDYQKQHNDWSKVTSLICWSICCINVLPTFTLHFSTVVKMCRSKAPSFLYIHWCLPRMLQGWNWTTITLLTFTYLLKKIVLVFMQSYRNIYSRLLYCCWASSHGSDMLGGHGKTLQRKLQVSQHNWHSTDASVDHVLWPASIWENSQYNSWQLLLQQWFWD